MRELVNLIVSTLFYIAISSLRFTLKSIIIWFLEFSLILLISICLFLSVCLFVCLSVYLFIFIIYLCFYPLEIVSLLPPVLLRKSFYKTPIYAKYTWVHSIMTSGTLVISFVHRGRKVWVTGTEDDTRMVDYEYFFLNFLINASWLEKKEIKITCDLKNAVNS